MIEFASTLFLVMVLTAGALGVAHVAIAVGDYIEAVRERRRAWREWRQE